MYNINYMLSNIISSMCNGKKKQGREDHLFLKAVNKEQKLE